MRVYDDRDQAGLAAAFEVDNTCISRNGVAHLVAGVPGVQIQRRPTLFCGEDFLEFTLDGVRFVACEPFNDNSRYLIGSRPPEASPQLSAIRAAFVAYRPPKRIVVAAVLNVGVVSGGVWRLAVAGPKACPWCVALVLLGLLLAMPTYRVLAGVVGKRSDW